jgi:hypothetical protein
VKKSLSTDSYQSFGKALKEYRTDYNFEAIVAALTELFTDCVDKYPLFRGEVLFDILHVTG